MKKEKTKFKSGPIRELSETEALIAFKIKAVIKGEREIENITKLPAFLSNDGEERHLIFSQTISEKIISDHGNIIPENLVINTNDWDVALKNLKAIDPNTGVIATNPDKINLIKRVPKSDNFLVVAALRVNGFFIVTHYEVIPKSNELKSLLGRGDLLASDGTPLGPKDFLVRSLA